MKNVAILRKLGSHYSKVFQDDVRRLLFIQELNLDIFPDGPETTQFVAQKANFGNLSAPTEFYFSAENAEELLDQLALTWANEGKVTRYGNSDPMWTLFVDGDLFSLQKLNAKVRSDLANMDETTRVNLAQRINAPSLDVDILEFHLIDFCMEVGYAPY